MKILLFSSLLLFNFSIAVCQDFEWVKHMVPTSGSWDIGEAVTTDLNGNVYISGYFNGTVDFDPDNSLQRNITSTSTTGKSDIFIQSLDANGDLRWVKSFGGEGNERVFAIVTDSQNNVYVGGYFQVTVDLTSIGAIGVTITSNGLDDMVLVKFDSDGNYIFHKVSYLK